MSAYPAAYCPRCGTELGSVEREGRERRYCPACEAVRWRNAVPTTSVAVVDADGVLLIERGVGRDAGRWDLPAGHPEHDEPTPEAAARELREETGVRVDPGELDLAGTVHTAGSEVSYRSINYRVDRGATVGDPTAGSDAAAAAFVPLSSVREGDPDVRELGRRRLRDVGLL